MRKKVLMCLGVLIVVLIIVLAVILCVKVNNKENEEVIIDDTNKVEVYTPVVPEKSDDEFAEKELASTDAKKAEINKKLANDLVQSMINSKTISTTYKEGKTLINEFNNGKFTDEEKFKLLYSKLDFSDEVNIYSQTPEAWVKTEDIEKAANELFGESINILNLKYVVIKNGQVEYTRPTGFGIQIYKIKSAILDRKSNVCIVKFDMLGYNADYVPYDVVKYNQADVLATFELKAEMQKDGSYIVKELNKI